MSRVYLIRHAQAGPRRSYDSLSDLGRAQARRLGEFLAGQSVPFTAVYAGAQKRQQETAQAVLDAYCRAGVQYPDLTVEPRWNEFDMSGIYEQLAPRVASEDAEFARQFDEISQAASDETHALHRMRTSLDLAVIRAWIEGKHGFTGESWEHFRARIAACLDIFDAAGPGEIVAVFTSATPIAIWTSMALGVLNEKVLSLAGAVYNTGLTTLRVRRRQLTLFSFNCVPHLSEPGLLTFR